MARTKLTARKSIGGKAPRKMLVIKETKKPFMPTQENITDDIGFWLKDIPYIWTKTDGNKYRQYLIDIESKDSPFYPLKTKRNCQNFYNLFRIMKVGDYVLTSSLDLRVNGRKLPIPKGARMDLDDYHKYAGIPRIKINPPDLKAMIIRKSPDEDQFETIHLPSITPTETTEPLKGELGSKRSLFDLLWYLELVKKYKKACIPLGEDYGEKKEMKVINQVAYFMYLHLFINDEKWEDIQMPYSPLIDIIFKCMRSPNINMILVPLSFQYQFTKPQTGHANLIVINKVLKQIEIFDPHGKSQYEDKVTKKIPDVLARYFEHPFRDFKYVFSSHFCPKKSFQALEGFDIATGDYAGFCAVWSLWYLEIKLMHPEMDSSELVTKAMQTLVKKAPSSSFRKYIRKYASLIEKHGEKRRKELGLKFKTPHMEDGKKVRIEFTKEDWNVIRNDVHELRKELFARL